MTQAQMAKENNITIAEYGRVERGDTHSINEDPPSLADHELALLYRRRAKATQAEMAEWLDCSRYWINLMETGKADCTMLLWYWEQ
jgi:DNA-binding XRE family transcriptional regulator